MHLLESKFFRVFFGLGLIVGAIALIRDTVYVGNDFDVFWKAARLVLEGENPYSVARDGPMVFKYPPWIIPAFFPIAIFPLEAARWVFGTINVLCIVFVVRFLFRHGLNKKLVFLVLLMFWGIWAVHALDGQVNLLILTAYLWSLEQLGVFGREGRKSRFAEALVLYALTVKVFTFLPAIALLGLKRFRGIRPWAYFACACILLSLPAWNSMTKSSEQTRTQALFSEWANAAGSGGTAFHGEKVRGRENQGLPAFVMRALNIPARDKNADLVAFAGIAIGVLAVWMFLAKSIRISDPLVYWTIWIALVPVLHPLAWFHLFVMAFPLACLALDRAHGKTKYLVGFMVFCLVIVTEKTFGKLGLQLEMLSIKAFSILALISIFLIASKTGVPMVRRLQHVRTSE